ncbi:unnamed protein product [Brassica oleracea var. botrytis]
MCWRAHQIWIGGFLFWEAIQTGRSEVYEFLMLFV